MSNWKIVNDNKIKQKVHPEEPIHQDELDDDSIEFAKELGFDPSQVNVDVSGNRSAPAGYHDQPYSQTVIGEFVGVAYKVIR